MSTTVAPPPEVTGTKTPQIKANLPEVCSIAAPIAVLLVLAWRRRWVAEDAFINYRIVENFLNGDGLVFNVGERVEAGTSTLWLLVLAVCDLLPVPLSVEWWSVLLGVGLTAVGLGAGAAAALRLSSRPKAVSVAVPLGVVVLAVLPPMWDYVTSGLENGLSHAWLGVSFLLLVMAYESATSKRSLVAALVMSLGVLVRPDLGVFWAGFGVALVLCVWRRGLRGVIHTVIALLLIPIAFEVYRLGYFAALAPNTALTKEASMFRPDQGMRYLYDLVRPYFLVFPAVLVAVIAVFTAPRENRLSQAIWATPVACGLVHAAFVVLVGGDYMHGRMLLPSLFGVLLPVMAVRATRRTAVSVFLVWVWAATCLLYLRADLDPTGASFIGDERAFYVNAAVGSDPTPPRNPVTLDDYSNVTFTQLGMVDAAKVKTNPRIYKDLPPVPAYEGERPLPPNVDASMVVSIPNIGMYGYAVGPDVVVLDALGLADPLASRIEIKERGKPGHEKHLEPVWFQARYAPSSVPGAQEAAASRALACGDIAKILSATSDPLTPKLFVSNMFNAASYWKVRIPADPVAAEAKFCR